jgi:hypothetical protein
MRIGKKHGRRRDYPVYQFEQQLKIDLNKFQEEWVGLSHGQVMGAYSHASSLLPTVAPDALLVGNIDGRGVPLTDLLAWNTKDAFVADSTM